MDATPGTQSVDRAARLLVAVLQSPRPVTFTDLQRSSGLAKSTVSRILSSLERHGLILRAEDGTLGPGSILTRFAHSSQPHDALISLAAPYLQALSEATGETINLAVLIGNGIGNENGNENGNGIGNEVEQIDQVDCTYLMGNVNWVGQRVPLHCSALGKVFLAAGAELPSGRLERRTDRTISTRQALEADLAIVRERGWAIADSELEPGLIAVAAPVHSAEGVVIAAISISGPALRITAARAAAFGELLVATTGELSADLGFPHRKISLPPKKRKASA